jgi:hypothetical protein
LWNVKFLDGTWYMGGENGERKVERRKHKGTGMKNEGRNIRPLVKGG